MWIPHKEKCPRGMTIAERKALLDESLPVDPTDPHSRRFAIRRVDGLEIFDIKHGCDVDGEAEFHGHPASRIDPKVLKRLRDSGQITPAEFNQLRKELPGC